MNYTHRDITFSELRTFLQNHPTSNVLEIGAGGNDNPNAISAKDIFNEFKIEYTGIDKFAKSEPNGLIRMDAHDLQFNDETFDLIYLCHTFEHLENPIKAIKQMKRVLKKGGFIWMATPNPCEHHILLKDPDHIFVLEPMQLMRLFIYCGLKCASYKQYSFNNVFIPKYQDINVITIARKDE